MISFGMVIGVRVLSPAMEVDDSFTAYGQEEMPRLLELLARVQADSLLSLAETLETDRAAGMPVGTLVVITPDFEDRRLDTFLSEWDTRGGQHFALALDAKSFRSRTESSPYQFERWDNPAVRRVRHGDDLQSLLESGEYGWNGQ